MYKLSNILRERWVIQNMTKNEFYYTSADGKTQIHAVEWLPEGTPKAILQIAHGVTEHILRYEELAEFFTQRGIAVVGNDHLGHGYSIAKDSPAMYFGLISWFFCNQKFFDSSSR